MMKIMEWAKHKRVTLAALTHMAIQTTRRFRTASAADIPSLAAIRLAVRENMLRSTITQKMYRDALTTHGQGWVCEIGE